MQRRTRGRQTGAAKDKLLAAYRRSGLTQKEFAAQAGLGLSTLSLWLRQAASAKTPGPSALVPVPNLFAPAAPPPAYRLQFPRGVIVEVASGFQSEELSALLQAVEGL